MTFFVSLLCSFFIVFYVVSSLSFCNIDKTGNIKIMNVSLFRLSSSVISG